MLSSLGIACLFIPQKGVWWMAKLFCVGILFRCVLGCVREWGQTNWGNMVNYNKIHQPRNYLLGASDNKWITM